MCTGAFMLILLLRTGRRLQAASLRFVRLDVRFVARGPLMWRFGDTLFPLATFGSRQRHGRHSFPCMMHTHPDRFMLVPFERRPIVKRGAVTVTFDPLEIRWNGERVPLSPIEATLLNALVRRSRLKWQDINTILADAGCCAESRDVLIHRVRRKFAELGASDPIETLRGWGIRFRAECDTEGSTTFWIGAHEGDQTLPF